MSVYSGFPEQDFANLPDILCSVSIVKEHSGRGPKEDATVETVVAVSSPFSWHLQTLKVGIFTSVTTLSAIVC